MLNKIYIPNKLRIRFETNFTEDLEKLLKHIRITYKGNNYIQFKDYKQIWKERGFCFINRYLKRDEDR